MSDDLAARQDIAATFHVANPAIDATALAESVRRNLETRPPLTEDLSTYLATFGSPAFLPSPDDPAYNVVQLELMVQHRVPSDRIRAADGRLGAVMNQIRA